MGDAPNPDFSYAFIDAVCYQGKGDITKCQRALLIASMHARSDAEQNKIADFIKEYNIPC